MHQQDARAVGRIALAAAVWSSCLPVVSACDFCDGNINGLSRQTMIGIVAACAVLALFLGICGLCLRRRRLRARAMRLPVGSYQPPKQSYVPVSSGYAVYHQATLPAPPPLHIPQYPPRWHDTYHGNPRWQGSSPSNVRTRPEPVTPVSPLSLRASSSVTSRPISSLSATPLSIAMTPPPPSPTASASPRSTQRNVVGASLPPLPPSTPPRSPPIVIFPPASSAIPLSNALRPSALSPVHTGTSNNVDEAPPAYTPI